MRRLFVTTLVAAIALGSAMPVASAQFFPNGGPRGGFQDYDPVTGYLCVTPSCDVVRMSEARCICTKDNPGERRLSRLKLTCSKREAGKWIACPVKPTYGR